MKVLLFSGTRYLTPTQRVNLLEELLDIKATVQPDLVIVGDAKGVDRLVANVFEDQTARFVADWKKYNKAAGAIRNSDMVKAAELLGVKEGYAYPGPNSKGTWDCIKKVVAKGITMYVSRP
jgi:LmbE family N-acetylglucosaminyl deacetylase